MSTMSVACKLPMGLIIEVGEKKVVLQGPNRADNVIGSFGITDGVDQSFWDAWVASHKWMDVVKKEFVFAYEKPSAAAAQAKERAAVKTGLEPLSQDDKPAGITAVE